MKPLFIALIALSLTACGTFRGILTDEYESESELLDACEVESVYLRLTEAEADEACGKALDLYREVRKARQTFDADALRDLLRQRILDRITG